MASIPRHVPPVGLMGLRKGLLVGIVSGVVLVGLGAAWAVQRLTARTPPAATAPALPVSATLTASRKAILADEPRTYDAIPKPKPKPAVTLPPQGVPVARPEAALRPPEGPKPERPAAKVEPLATPPGPSQAEIDARIRAAVAEKMLQMREEQARLLEAQLTSERARQSGQSQAPGTASPSTDAEQKRRKKQWAVSEPASIQVTRAEDHASAQKEEVLPSEKARRLLPDAVWAHPEHPERILFRDQFIPGILEDAVNSDIPGQIRVRVMRDVVDRQLRGYILIPQLSTVLCTLVGEPKYGQRRLDAKCDMIIFPDGTTLELAETKLGEGDGATGVAADVNNHWPKLIAAVGISMGLSIGSQYAAGTPGRGQYYQDPAQQAVRDATGQLNADTKRIVEQQLRVPPTLTQLAGHEVTLHPSLNINFGTAPVRVR